MTRLVAWNLNYSHPYIECTLSKMVIESIHVVRWFVTIIVEVGFPCIRMK